MQTASKMRTHMTGGVLVGMGSAAAHKLWSLTGCAGWDDRLPYDWTPSNEPASQEQASSAVNAPASNDTTKQTAQSSPASRNIHPQYVGSTLLITEHLQMQGTQLLAHLQVALHLTVMLHSQIKAHLQLKTHPHEPYTSTTRQKQSMQLQHQKIHIRPT